MAGVRHAPIAGPNNAAYQVSETVYEDDHLIDPASIALDRLVGVPGATTQFLRRDGVWAAPAGAGGGGGVASHLFVNPNRPDDTGDGQTWDTAKKTIQAAHDTLPTEGGGIAIPGLDVVEDGITFTKRVHLYSPAGLAAQISATTPDATILTLSGEGPSGSIIEAIEFDDDVVAGHAQGAIDVDGPQDWIIRSCWFNEMGEGDTPGQSHLTRPFGIRIDGAGSYADWFKIESCRFRGCYTSIIGKAQSTANANGFIDDCNFFGNGDAEHIYWDASDTVRMNNTWFAGGPQGGYQIRLVSGGGWQINNMHCELSAVAAPGDHFMLIASSRNMLNNVFFNGGGHKSAITPEAIRFATGSVDNKVRNHQERSNGEGEGVYIADDATAAANNYVDDLSDYSAAIGT